MPNPDIYIYISICIYIYLYIYIEKKNAMFGILLHSFAKERNVLALFYVLCKRMKHSLCSFTFFSKERIVLVGLISRQKLKKRIQKNVKERCVL